jgi:hypothetical protein
MKLFLDTKARRFIKSAASNVALQTLVLKRRDQVPLEVVFVENGVAVDPVAGTQTTVALKSSFSDSNFLALAAPGTNTLDLYTEPVEAAFSSDPASIPAFLEIRWTAPTQALRTATLQVEIQNSVILGDEATPAALPDGKATQEEAEAGEDHTKWMTPLRTAQAVQAQVSQALADANERIDFVLENLDPEKIDSIAEAVETIGSERTERIAGDEALQTAIDAETTRATAAEQSIASDLAQEILDRTAGDEALSDRIDLLASNLGTESLDSIAEAAAAINTLQTQVDSKAPAVHTHTASQITDFAEAVVAVSPPVDWSSLTGKPTEFPPEAHTHPASDITGLSEFIISSAPGLQINTTVRIGDGVSTTFPIDGLVSSDPEHVLVALNGVTQTPGTDYLVSEATGTITFDAPPAAGMQISCTALGLRTVQPPIDPTLYLYAFDQSSDGLTTFLGRLLNADRPAEPALPETATTWTIRRSTYTPAGRVLTTAEASGAWADRTTLSYS